MTDEREIELQATIALLRTRNDHLQKMLDEATRSWLDEVAARMAAALLAEGKQRKEMRHG